VKRGAEEIAVAQVHGDQYEATQQECQEEGETVGVVESRDEHEEQ
jgi:hypothetical protein